VERLGVFPDKTGHGRRFGRRRVQWTQWSCEVNVEQLKLFFNSLRYDAALRDVATLLGYAVVGGLLGLYVRAIFRRFASTLSNRDTFSANFPLLVVITILVIYVVKSSLALSLGLVGALSIVRFRAAIKEPEEIIYLFACIAVGLGLGAEYLGITLAGTAVFSLFVFVTHFVRRKSREHTILLTIAGPRSEFFDGDAERITGLVAQAVGPFTLQRLETDGELVQFRAVVAPDDVAHVGRMIGSLQKQLPACRVSYVNLENLL